MIIFSLVRAKSS